MICRAPTGSLRRFVVSMWASEDHDARSLAPRELVVPTGTMHLAIRLDAPLRLFATARSSGMRWWAERVCWRTIEAWPSRAGASAGSCGLAWRARSSELRRRSLPIGTRHWMRSGERRPQVTGLSVREYRAAAVGSPNHVPR